MKEKYITLTHFLIRDKNITLQEKIIYMEILNLSSLEKGCVASNEHFSKSFNISKKSISKTINILIKKGYITSKKSNRNHLRILSTKSGQASTKSGQASTKSGESKENTTINKTINRETHAISDVIAAYKENVSTLQSKIKESKSYNEIIKNKKDISLIIIGIKNYAKTNPEIKYIKALDNFIRDKIYLDFQETKKELDQWN